MVNRNRLFLLLRYYKNFWKLKDKWPPGEAWVLDLVSDKASDIVAWLTESIPASLSDWQDSVVQPERGKVSACMHANTKITMMCHVVFILLQSSSAGVRWGRYYYRFKGCNLYFTCLTLLQCKISYLAPSSPNATLRLLPYNELATAIIITSLCPQLHLGNTTLLSVLHLTFYCLHTLNLNAHNISIRSDSTNDKNLFKCYHYLLLHYY